MPLGEARLLARPGSMVWRAHRRAPSLGRVLLLASVLTLLLAVSWWGYATFVWRPAPLSQPLSAIEVLAAGPVWGVARGDVGGTAQTVATLGAPDRAWQVRLGVLVAAAPVADGERLFVPLEDDRLVALSLRDGQTVWTYDATVPLAGSPVLAGNRVHVANRRCEVLALDAADGRTAWHAQGAGQAYSGPVLARGVVYQQCSREIVAFDAEDGRRLWGYPLRDQAVLTMPAVDGSYLAASFDDHIQLFDTRTGTHTFAYPQSGTRGLIVIGGTAYGVSPRFVAALDTASRAPWWEGLRPVRNQFWIWGLSAEPPRPPARWITQISPSHDARYAGDDLFPPALDDDRIYLANRDGLVRVYARATGALQYELDAGRVTAAPVRAADALLLSTPDRIELRDPATGALRSAVAVAGDRWRYLVLTTQGLFTIDRVDGTVVAYR